MKRYRRAEERLVLAAEKFPSMPSESELREVPDTSEPGAIRIAYRTAAKARVESAKRRARESAVPPGQMPDPLAEISARELIAVLDEELSALASRYRGPLVLCYLEGKTRDEAAAQFGLSLATLARRLERGRDMLKARLTRRGLALPAVGSLMLCYGSAASASVPPSLVASTVSAAALVVAGVTTTGAVISPNVIVLTEGVLKTMFITKLKIAAAMILLAGMLGAAVGTTLYASRTEAQPPAQKGPQAKGDKPLPKDTKNDGVDDTLETRRKNASVRALQEIVGALIMVNDVRAPRPRDGMRG